MASLGDLIAKLKIDDNEWRSGLTSGERALNRFGGNLKSIGTSMSTYITAPFAALGVIAVSTASSFQTAMNSVAAKSGATGQALDQLRAQAQELGATTKFSATEAADGMTLLAAAGFNAEQTMNALPGVLALAATENMNLATAADIATSTMATFNIGAEKMGSVADILATASTESKSSVESLGLALSYVGPIAVTAGMSLEQTAAALATLSQKGIDGEKAGTGLRGVIASLVSPSTDAAKAFNELGVSMADLEGKSPQEALKLLNDSGMNLQQTFTIFGREAASTASILASSSGEYDRIKTAIDAADGSAKAMAATMQSGLPGAITSLKSAWEGLLLAISDSGLGSAAEGLINFTTGMIREAQQLNPILLTTATVIAGVAAAIGPTLIAIGALSTAFTSGLATVTSLGAGLLLLPARITALSTAITTGLLPSLLAVSPAIAVAAGALAGWKLAEWLNENSEAWRNFADAAIQAGKDLGILDSDLNRVHDTNAALVAKTADLERELANVGITVDRGSKSVATYYSELVKAGAESGLFGSRTSTVTQQISQYAVGLGAAQGTTKQFGDQAKATANDVSFFKDQLDQAIEEGKSFKDAESAILNALSNISGALPQLARDFDIIPQAVNNFTPNIIGKFSSIAQSAEDMGKRVSSVELLGAKMQREDALMVAYKTRLDEINAGFIALNTNLPQAGQSFDDFKKKSEDTRQPLLQISTIVTDLSKGLVDLAFEGGKFTDVLKEMGKAILRTIAEDVMGKLVGGINKLIGQIPGVSSLKDAFGQLSGAIGGGAEGAQGAASSVGKSLSSALSGLSNVFGMVTGAISAVTDIIGVFQNAQQEGSLNAIELNTRETFGTLRDDIKPTLWHISEWVDQILPSVQAQEKTLFSIFQTGETTNNILGEMKAHLASLVTGVIIVGGSVGISGTVAGGIPTTITNTPSVEVINLEEMSVPPGGPTTPPRSRQQPNPPNILGGLVNPYGGNGLDQMGNVTTPTTTDQFGNPLPGIPQEGGLSGYVVLPPGYDPNAITDQIGTGQTPSTPSRSRQTPNGPTLTGYVDLTGQSGTQQPLPPVGNPVEQIPQEPTAPGVPPRSRQTGPITPPPPLPQPTPEDIARNEQLERIAILLERNPYAVLGSGENPLASLVTGGLQVTVPEGEELDVTDPEAILALDRSQQTQEQTQATLEETQTTAEEQLTTEQETLTLTQYQNELLGQQQTTLTGILQAVSTLADRPIVINVMIDGQQLTEQVGLNIDIIESANR